MRNTKIRASLVLGCIAAAALATGASASGASSHKSASGTPIKLAMINAQTGSLTFPESSAGAQAAVSYVNAHGGVRGRPLKLSVCATDNSANGSASCANKLLANKPAAFIGGFDVGAAGSRPILDKAGVPTIGGVTNTSQALDDPIGFAFDNNIVSIFSGAATFAATKLHDKNIVLLSLAQPSNAFVLQKLVNPITKKLGVTTSLVQIPDTATDITASVEAALSKKPTALIVAVATPQCAVASSTARRLGYKGTYIGLGNCAGQSVLSSAAGGLNNAYIAMTYRNPYVGSSSPDVALFRGAMKKYAPSGTALDEDSMDAFASIMNFTTVMNAGSGPVTSASIISAFRKAKDVHAFLSTSFTCNKSIKAAPAVCAAVMWPQQVRNGKLTPVGTAIDAGARL